MIKVKIWCFKEISFMKKILLQILTIKDNCNFWINLLSIKKYFFYEIFKKKIKKSENFENYIKIKNYLKKKKIKIVNYN